MTYDHIQSMDWDGVQETGVSLALTVCALDAEPVIASERIEVDDQIKVRIILA